MSILNGNINIKIHEIQKISWETLNVSVAARPYNALAFRLEGEASFSTSTQYIETSKNDILFMPAGCDYTVQYKEKNSMLVIHFFSDTDAQLENFHVENPHLIYNLFCQIYKTWNEKAAGYYYKSLSLLCEILEILAVNQNFSLCDNTKKYFEKALNYMENNYLSSDFSIKKMVSEAKMSDTYFRKLFLQRFGTTPIQFLIQKRLIHAEKLLMTGNYTVCEVSEMSGFEDVKYFSRVVKKIYGTPPSKLYRHAN